MTGAVRCIDLSQRKEKLAVIDEAGLCQVYNSLTGELIYQVQHFYSNSIFYLHLSNLGTECKQCCLEHSVRGHDSVQW